MKSDIFKIIIAASIFLTSMVAEAQNLDPTVEVNRAYEGKLLEVNKPSMTMAVPDSVRQFALDFDYSVFENPYKGSYEFKPYQLLMKPYASGKEVSQFWLKVGAGYTLHPELSAVWTPALKGKFRMNVYADHNSYIGGYRTFSPGSLDKPALTLARWNDKNRKVSYWNGYRMRSKAGFDGQYDWEAGKFAFDAAYYGIASKDSLKNRAYDAVAVNLSVASKPQSGDHFLYDVTASYRFAEDKLKYKFDDAFQAEHDFGFNASVGQVFAGSHSVMFDLGFSSLFYSGEMPVNVGEIMIAPHYVFSKNRILFDVGVKIAKLFGPEQNINFQTKDQVIYPDVNIRFVAIPDVLSVYAKVGGGNRINSYMDILERNPFMDFSFARNGALMDATVERVSMRLGIEGHLAKRLAYDVHAGYANYKNDLLDAVILSNTDSKEYMYMPGFIYAAYQKLYAGIDIDWRSDRVSFDGSFEYAAYKGAEEVYGAFTPSPITADAAFEYNWNRRIFVGVDCRYASSRKSVLTSTDSEISATFTPVKAVMPGFVDLGMYAEYATSRKLSFWLRGGNLLNMTVQYTPLYAERGINFTAGICLKL